MGFMDGFAFWLGKMAAEIVVMSGLAVIFALLALVIWLVDRR